MAKKKKLKISDIKKNSDTEVISTIDRIKRHEKEYLLVTAAIFMLIILAIVYSLFGISEKDIKTSSYDADIMGVSEVITLNEESIVDSNETGLLLDKNTFTVSNKATGKHKFKVFINEDQSMIDLDGCGDKIANDDSIFFKVNDGEIKSLNEVLVEDGYLILEDEISKESKDYDLYIWILRDKLHDINRNHFHGNIVIEEIEEE